MDAVQATQAVRLFPPASQAARTNFMGVYTGGVFRGMHSYSLWGACVHSHADGGHVNICRAHAMHMHMPSHIIYRGACTYRYIMHNMLSFFCSQAEPFAHPFIFCFGTLVLLSCFSSQGAPMHGTYFYLFSPQPRALSTRSRKTCTTQNIFKQPRSQSW